MDLIPVMYPLGDGSREKDFELRMSLRSIEKHLHNYGEVYIVGELPTWVQNVTHIPFKETSKLPDYNIMKKIEKAFEVIDEMLFFNDDHYLLIPFDANTFPYYYNVDLKDYVKKRGLDGYGRRANNTFRALKDKNLPTKFFDIHTPIIYNKEKFIETVVKGVDWETNKDGFIIKSLYANSLNIIGFEERDWKVNAPPHPKAKVFSTHPKIKGSIQRFLMEQFPIQSKYEKTGL